MTPLSLLLLASSCLGGPQYITYTPTGATVLPHASRYSPYTPSGAALAYTGYPQGHYTRYPQAHYYLAPITAGGPLTAFRYGLVSPSASLRLVPASGSLVAETRRQAEIVKATLRALPLDPTTADLVDNLLAGSQCLNSVDQAIAAIDAGVSAIVVSESDIELLSRQVRSLQGQKKAPGLMLSTADVVETLGSFLPKLSAPATQGEICGTGTEATFQELRELARIISDAATLPGAQFSSNKLRKTGSTLYAVVGFLKDVSQTYAGLSNTCATDPTRGKSSALALGSTLEDLADLLGVLGSYTEAEKTRQGAKQVKAALEAFESLDGLDLWETDCGSANLEGAAANMRQLAAVLEDQGLLQISQELGIDLDLLPLGFEF